MRPYRTFWIAILAYGALSAAGFLYPIPADLPSVGGGVAGLLVAASAGYALLRPDRVSGPNEWNPAVIAAVGGAALSASIAILGAL
jgi:hypothetical protein